MKRIVISVVIVLVVGLVGWRIYQKVTGSQGPNRRNGVRAVAVAVEPVRKETIRDVGEFTGTLLPKSQFVVAPKVSGRLERLLVNIGDTVKKGDLIAVLDSEEYTQEVAQARAELQVSRANLADCRSALDVARRESERSKELREQKVASEAELDQAQARYQACEAKHEVALAQIKQKEAALKTAEVRLSYTRIHVAWDDAGGARLIGERSVDEGAMLTAGDPIVSVVDASSVIAVISVIERDFPEVRVGQAATVSTDAYPGREFHGKIVRRAPVLREESRQARVEIEVPNLEGLLAPGMFARVRIRFAERPDATVVPASALVRRNGRQGVFLADPAQGKAHFIAVSTGILSGDVAEILEPKLEGLVVTLGHHLLEDGGAIVVPEQDPSNKPKDAPVRSASPAKSGRPEGDRR